MKHFLRALSLVLLSALPAAAEVELSFYTGTQSAPHSDVSGTAPGVGPFKFQAGWEGKPFDMPPYYGLRATWWRSANLGYAFEVNHAKVYADKATLAKSGFSRLEFTDGHNLVTFNVFYRWPDAASRLTPYAGAGLGLAIPHVDVLVGGNKTYGYQVTGPVVQLVLGASYALNDTWSLFGEYKGTYSSNEADLKGGGTLKTDLITNALNVGLSYRF
ncbi:outer membrane beta-barrel protein [Actibacterium sp. MT2.3-13A]|uniref:outer membrane protein n=1 Tax=Actibacterium sp. MT2.3-13A TaxID=2828332 RepID=UPI001BAD5571|nr:outer membrane beta-barrel protein [Actibacterium sp. MT2.3-13A]